MEKGNYKHGYKRKANTHPLYNTWCRIKGRCYNKKNPKYKHYGARGIIVCKAWLDNPVAFIYWGLTHGWAPGLSIERKNNNGNYTPGNCTFITIGRQARNKTTTKLTAADVHAIRNALNEGHEQRPIAEAFGVSKALISQIKRFAAWKDI